MLKRDVGGGDGELWARRPLDVPALRYAAADALLTYRLGVVLTPELNRSAGSMERVLRASDARVREWRDLPDAVPQERCAAHGVAPEV